MKITLENVELVKDKTGVTYGEAKAALEKCDGNVVDAIVLIEQEVNENSSGGVKERAASMIDTMKEYIKKGNVSKILITKDKKVALNVPVNIGLVGAVISPLGVILSALVSLGMKCEIFIVKTDGSKICISEKANNAYASAKDSVNEKYGEQINEFKEKASEKASEFKEKAGEMASDLKDKAGETTSELKEKATDKISELKKKTSSKVKEAQEEISEEIEEIKEEMAGK